MLKSRYLKKFILIGLVISSILLLFIGFYSSKINFAGNFNVESIDTTTVKFKVVTPLNRHKTIYSSSYNGYFRDIQIESLNKPQSISQTFLGNETKLEFNRIAENLYHVTPPKLTYFQKISGFFVISKTVIFQLIIVLFFFISSLFLSIYFIKLVFKKRKEIVKELINGYKSTLKFIKVQNYNILIPAIIAILPGGILAMSDPDVSVFLNLNFIQIISSSLVIFYIPLFFIYFKKIFNTNIYFCVSFLLVFISLYFVFFPNLYIYGQYFRDDISKFFVKAYQHNFYNQFFTTDANYLNLFQNLISFIVLKVFRFKYYFPEVLQIIVLISIVLIYSSFNLKFFRKIMKCDFNRFLISILSPVLFIFLSKTYALYDIPFIATLIFLPILFLNFEKLTPIIQISIVFIFSVFILSKPIFIIFAFFVVIKIIYSYFQKDWKTFLGFGILLIAIFIQFEISYLSIQMVVAPISDSPLGTHYFSSFRQDKMSIIENFIYGFFVFLRVHVKLFFPYFTAVTNANIFINICTFLLVVLLNAWLIIRVLKNRTKKDLFILSGNIVGFLTCLLFVRTVSVNQLEENSINILNYNFIEMLQSGYLTTSHRYLIVVFAYSISSIGYFIYNKTKNIIPNTGSIITLVLIFGVFFNTVSFLENYKIFKPKHSVWRQNADLIFNYKNQFYIPYYGYPTESECIKFGIDRITEVTVPENGIIHFDSLEFQTDNWQVIQLVTEFDSVISPDIFAVKCVTTNNKELYYKSFNPINSSFRFIIFRFDFYISPKTITFVDKEMKPIKITKPIRLIGKY